MSQLKLLIHHPIYSCNSETLIGKKEYNNFLKIFALQKEN